MNVRRIAYLLAALLAPTAPAWACGGMMPKVGQVVASDAQQALFRIHDDAISVEYRVRYQGTAQDFGWIIPVPGEVEAVEEGDDATFEALEERSAPTVWQSESSGGGGGCINQKAGLSDKAGGLAAGDGVTVTGSGFAGDYEYVTLTADDAEGLQAWLDENGFDGSLAQEDIAAYVADPLGYAWVAVKVRADLAQPDAGTMFTPLRITYGPADDGALHASFPARMGRSSTADSDRLEIYVLADSLVDVGGGWIGTEVYGIEAESEDDAAARYEERLASLGSAGRAFAWVYSGEATDLGDDSAWFLTRFDTIVSPDVLTVDPVFTETGLQWSQETDIQIEPEEGGEAFVLVGLMGLGALRRRKIAA